MQGGGVPASVRGRGDRGHKARPFRQSMAETGESDVEARRQVVKARSRRQPSVEPEKIYVSYTLKLDGQLEFDAEAWANALSNERERMVEEAVTEQLDDDFATYGGQGIAECVDRGDLEFTATTGAEIRAKYDSESIEIASRAHAGIGDYDEWPGNLERPSVSDSYVTELARTCHTGHAAPDRVLPALRLLEVLTAVTAMGKRMTPTDLGGIHDDLAAKQAADVVGFLVGTAELDTGFRDRARSLLLGEPFAEPALLDQN